ncbi:MAG: hypothetical protein HUJ99_07345, partial [Bacteroidaceae bacterium]|nr:hypothetical protein [Bacteroidaceae bacterium]
MRKVTILFAAACGLTGAAVLTSCGPKYSIEEHGQYNLVIQQGGQTLGYSPESGVTLIEDGGYAFKDLNKNGKLDVYEDWRKTPQER